jgi:hypothetical protein
MAAIKQDSIETAETLLTAMKQKYANSSLTDEAEFNLAMEYIDISQNKINFYLNNDDNGSSLAAVVKDSAIEERFRKTQQIDYATYAGYLQKAIAFLMKSGSVKKDYINQLKAKQYYFYHKV